MNGMSFPRLALLLLVMAGVTYLMRVLPFTLLRRPVRSPFLHSLRGAECHGVSVYPVLDRIFPLRCCRNGCRAGACVFPALASGGGAWRLPCGDGCRGADGGGIGGAGSGRRIALPLWCLRGGLPLPCRLGGR